MRRETKTPAAWLLPGVRNILVPSRRCEPLPAPARARDADRISRGPFAGFRGVVKQVDAERQKLGVALSVFDREVPVELDFGQVVRVGG